jgi:hypothetical protein
MRGAWQAPSLLLAGAGLLMAGLTLPFPPGIEWAVWAFMIAGILALILGSMQVELIVHALHERIGRARPRSDIDTRD